MGVSQSIFKVIKSEVIRFLVPAIETADGVGGGVEKGMRMRVVNCGGVGS